MRRLKSILNLEKDMLTARSEHCGDFLIAEIDKCDLSKFNQYLDILVESYISLDFFRPSILPKTNTTCYGLWHRDSLEGIFGLTHLGYGEATVFRSLIDDVRALPGARLIEISNVVLRKKIRGSSALGALLYEAALIAHAQDFDFLVGITRYQALRHFVNFGAMPVFHDPLHLMDKSTVDDYVIYFDTHNNDALFYMHERARRYFRQESIMDKIKNRYIEQRHVSPQSRVGRSGNDAF